MDSLVVFDDVLIPWEDVFFYRHTRAAQFVRSTLHRYSAFPYVLRAMMDKLAEWVRRALCNMNPPRA